MKKPRGISQEEFEAKFCFKKQNVDLHEYKMHKIIYNAKVIRVPKIYSYDKQTKVMIMEKIPNMTISDYYGENASDVPVHIMNQIQEEITKLYYYGVYYPDITGYNFIIHNNNIYVIDFEHAMFYTKKSIDINPYVHEFMNGLCKWNEEFT
jgi:tRNA A-37 threonylcarbamoyl transferase component Bud32